VIAEPMAANIHVALTAPRTRQELVAACATHGRSPYNDRTLAYESNCPTPE
jgi:hypothetical protein